LRLPAENPADLRAARRTRGHARAPLALTNPTAQPRLPDDTLAHASCVRATEASIRAPEAAPRPRGAAPRTGRRRSPELAELEAGLQRALMTRVRIVGSERKGKIEVVYATGEELDRLTELLGARH